MANINTTINITKRGRLLLDAACEKDKRTLQAEVEVIMEDYCVRNQIDISKIEQQKVEKMNCIICNQEDIGLNHKCTDAAIASYNRRLSAKQSADTRADERRYGATETVGDRIAAGSNFIRLNEM